MIQSQGWVEQYVRRRLAPAESAAFEEHYFECDQCFSEVQDMERFVAGIRDAAASGRLSPQPDAQPTPHPEPLRWLMPAFIFALAALALVTVGLAYLAFVRLPASQAQLKEAAERNHVLDARLVQQDQRVALDSAPQPNVPVVILTAARGVADDSRLTVTKQTRNALLWIDIPPQPAGTLFQLTLTSGAAVSKTISGLERNENGALAASVPVSDLPPGQYLVRLHGEKPAGKMIAEFRMAVVQK